jgi:DNA-binding response OmpR family regulator
MEKEPISRINEDGTKVPNPGAGSMIAPGFGPEEPGEKTRPTILIADDDALFCRALKTRLAALGYNVIECRDGLGVLTKSSSAQLDAMILDHEMPLGDGRTIASNIRDNTDVPIIFLSGHDREKFRDIVMRLPDTYYLPKPLDDAKLAELLKAILRPLATTAS